MAEETRKKAHEEKPLEKFTVKELRAIAMEIPHSTAVSDMKKAELVAFIKEARGIKDKAPVGEKRHVARLKLTKAELKAKIRELKGARLQALEARDGKTAKDVRRRISRLKKKSRSAAGT
ncbi:MAG: transcription termination factor Rho [Proteobacteria bacterium]|nr:transcription termination factor Rho [Pseudomonadota bacterium]MBU2228168.1 transcription termination factor Rho [Pseudomonadota bacterium]MBU2260825.1 transcription termination factor Rho [Pseudomonadota bacterium]